MPVILIYLLSPLYCLLNLVDRLPPGVEEDEEDVVKHLEESDKAAAHAQAEDTADVGHEPDDWDLLVSLDQSHRRVFDVDVGQKEIFPSVPGESKK